MDKTEKQENKNLSNVTNQEEQQNHMGEENHLIVDNNNVLDKLFHDNEEYQRRLKAGEEFRPFDLKQFMKTLEKDTEFTRLYNNKKDESILRDHIETILSNRYYQVTDERLTEILLVWKISHEPPAFNPQDPLPLIGWLNKHDPTWKNLTTKTSRRAYLKYNKDFNLDNNSIEIIIGYKHQAKVKTSISPIKNTTKNQKHIDPLSNPPPPDPELISKIKQTEKYPKFLWPFLYPNLRDYSLNEELRNINYKWITKNGEDVEVRRSDLEIVDDLADLLIEEISLFTRDDNDKIYWWDEKIWNEKGEILIKQIIEKTVPQASTYIVRECIAKIRRLTYLTNTAERINNLRYLTFQNNILDKKIFEFTPFNKEYYLTFALPSLYDPKADCSKIKEACELWVGKENVHLLQEVFGFCLIIGHKIKELVVLIGRTDTGKTIFLKLLSIFLGEKVTAASIQQLSNEKWHVADLRYALANICPDIPDKKVADSSVVKRVTSGDWMRGERKGEHPFDFQPECKLIFSCNNFPYIQDDTEAVINRLVFIDFIHRFIGKEKRDPNELIEELTTPEELSGLLNWALEGAKNLLKRGSFLTVEEKKQRNRKYEAITQSITFPIEEEYDFDELDWTANEELYECHERHCRKYNIEPIPRKRYIKIVKRIYKGKIKESRRRDPERGGKSTHGLAGIRKKDAGTEKDVIAEVESAF